MLNLQPMPTLRELLEDWERLPKEDKLALTPPLKTLVRLQEYPDIAIAELTGIALPPHQRLMLYQAHRGVGSNINVSSRGTSKSATWCVLYANYKALTFSRRDAVTLSATGFRGGQLIFADAERWLRGGWDDQVPVPAFFRDAIKRPQIITRAQNVWHIEYDSYSKNTTLPTKDHDAIRGVRGKDLYVDEANFTDPELIDKVAQPFLNVTSGFRTGGAYAAGNSVYYTTTIDYSHRPFQDRIKAAREGLMRDYLACQAMQSGDWARYEELELQGLHEHTLVSFDYTDLLIRDRVTSRSGRQFEVTWPNPQIPLTTDRRGIPFTQRDAEGKMRKHGDPVRYYKTYPIDKTGLERSLLDGSADEGSWLAEQRNITDTASGDVYDNALVDQVSCEGEHSITPYAEMAEEWRTRYKDEPRDYTPPILWSCTDPCVLGVDYAPVSDFTAFTVVRLGPCAQGEFDPFTHHGKTPWSNVIWAEQHQKMSAREVSEKIWALMGRYNLTYYHDPHVDDPWLMCRAIGLDMRGGGSAVRDELCFINDEQPPRGRYRIYDPFDQDERIMGFANDPKSKPMLDGIMPSDQLNDRLVEFSVSQMRSGLLYLPKYLDLSQRPLGARELHVGYDASRALASQLRKLRQEPTKNYRSFYVDGDRTKASGKKDLWASLMYALRQARAHLIRQAQIDNAALPMGAVITRVGGKRGGYGAGAGGRAFR